MSVPAVRRATVDDIPEISKMAFEEYMEEQAFRLGLNFSLLVVQYGLKRLVDDPNIGSLLVAEQDGRLLGFYSCRYDPSMLDYSQAICVETGWYVRPEARGKGVGKALLKESVRLAWAKGIRMKKVAHAVTTDSGRSLMSWYEKMGYMPFETQAFKVLTEEDIK